MAVKLNNEIEKSLWVDIFSEYMKRPDGHEDIGSQSGLASQYADEAIIVFRARAGNHLHSEVTVQTLTNDTKFQELHG